MKIFLAGAVSSANENQLKKYNIYKNTLKSYGELITPDDIWSYREKCIKENPKINKLEIDKMMTDYDLNCVRNCDLIICDISLQSTGMGIELGVSHENKKNIIFFYEKGSYVSSMITGSFVTSLFIEYPDLKNLEKEIIKAIKTL